MPARLRAAGPDDATIIRRLIVDLATYEREPDAVVVTVDELRDQLGAARPPFECLLAEDDDGAAVGFALYFAHLLDLPRAARACYLEDLFVEPSRPRPRARHRGSCCCAPARRKRRRARLRRASTGAVLDWNAPAIAFYERLGAHAMAQWTTFRLTDAALHGLALGTS
jgi:GNAT superfamily N-acetyltransferase